MRAIIISFFLIILVAITGLIHLSINNITIREKELKTSLDTTIDDTLETLFVNKLYTIDNIDELMSDFCKSYMLRQNSNSKITVKLLSVDTENGILYIEVKSNFIFPTGKEKTIKCEKTVILEEKES